jgi:hypothetical protein
MKCIALLSIVTPMLMVEQALRQNRIEPNHEIISHGESNPAHSSAPITYRED